VLERAPLTGYFGFGATALVLRLYNYSLKEFANFALNCGARRKVLLQYGLFDLQD
jgi:hypothetical protein